jgi:RsiW-degrading membrane proteinase PrsW (M82 family)
MTCPTFFPYLVAFITLPILALKSAILAWFLKLKSMNDCNCSQDWRRTYMQWYFTVAIAYTIFYLLYNLITGCKKKTGVLLLIDGVLLIAAVIYIILAFQYLTFLKEQKCECATKGHGDELLRAHAIFYILVLCLAMFLPIGFVAFTIGRIYASSK